MALQVATRFADRMADGVWFVELAPMVDAALVPGMIAGALRSELPPHADPLTGLITALADKRLLLVLDNCEHLIAAVGTVATALVQRCPQLTLLATSRQPLGIAGEAMLQIPSLPVPDEAAAACLDRLGVRNFAAVTLFADRARAAESRFELTDQNASVVADICRRLDGIPLAIELAATRVKLLSPRDLRDRLDERLRLLTGGSRDAVPRQQTLRALIDWSYGLLDERERQLFRRVAVFADGFTLEAASIVCGDAGSDELDVLDVLASLVDKSLILAAVAGDSTRFKLLESTRLYALEALAANDQRAAIEARHVEFFCDALVAAEQALERQRRTVHRAHAGSRKRSGGASVLGDLGQSRCRRHPGGCCRAILRPHRASRRRDRVARSGARNRGSFGFGAPKPDVERHRFSRGKRRPGRRTSVRARRGLDRVGAVDGRS